MLDLNLLLIFIFLTALFAVEAKDLMSSIIGLSATGLGLCTVFLILKGPDVAMTQLVIETLSLIILIRVTLNRDLDFSASGRWLLNTAVFGLFVATFSIVAVQAFRILPVFGQPYMKIADAYLKEGLAKTGATNIVSAIVLDFRALDTLCEATVLFTSVVAVLAIVRRTGRIKEGQTVDDEE
jgi:multicomponent Na+:H+ antiporter subunit B